MAMITPRSNLSVFLPSLYTNKPRIGPTITSIASIIRKICVIRLYEDTLSTLEELKKLGIKLTLCSNLAMPYGKIVSSLLPPLDAYAWSYEVAAIKLESKIYQSLINQLGYQASEVLFIGDTALADFTGPTAFGMSARLINRQNGQTLAEVLNDIL